MKKSLCFGCWQRINCRLGPAAIWLARWSCYVTWISVTSIERGVGLTDFIDDALREEDDSAGEQDADGSGPVIKLLDLSGGTIWVVSYQPHGQAGEIDVKHFEIFGVAQHVTDNGRTSVRNIVQRG